MINSYRKDEGNIIEKRSFSCKAEFDGKNPGKNFTIYKYRNYSKSVKQGVSIYEKQLRKGFEKI